MRKSSPAMSCVPRDHEPKWKESLNEVNILPFNFNHANGSKDNNSKMNLKKRQNKWQNPFFIEVLATLFGTKVWFLLWRCKGRNENVHFTILSSDLECWSGPGQYNPRILLYSPAVYWFTNPTVFLYWLNKQLTKGGTIRIPWPS